MLPRICFRRGEDMVGWFAFSGVRRFTLERTVLLGMPLLRLNVPAPRNERAAIRRAVRGAQLLGRAGCRRVLVPAGFPYWEQLRERGLRGVDPEPMVQALAVSLALADLSRRGIEPRKAAVALQGERVNRAFFEAAQMLCPRVRLLSIAAPNGGEDLRRFLREEFGAAALEAEALTPDCTLLFSPSHTEEATRAGEQPLHLYGWEPRLNGLAVRSREEAVPEGLEPLPVLALLWEEGRISTDELEIFADNRRGN